jgi:hypothetical protein
MAFIPTLLAKPSKYLTDHRSLVESMLILSLCKLVVRKLLVLMVCEVFDDAAAFT